MVMSVFIMEVILGELKYAPTRLGEQSVMIHGVIYNDARVVCRQLRYSPNGGLIVF